MKKIAIFWEKRFNDNNFTNLEIDKNLSPFKELINLNCDVISHNLLISKKDHNEYIILCFLTLSIFSIFDYIKLFIKYPKNKKYLFLFEPNVVAPLSYYKPIHKFFNRIYTWNDKLVDNKKYFKFIWPQSNNIDIKSKSYKDKKLVTLINWNKKSFIKNELYSEREKIIRYLEDNNIDFDLYWIGREKKNIKQFFSYLKKFESYKWKVSNKIEKLSYYKFNICFENMKNTPGYITEKIRDSLKAKSIPIYRWASNIEEYIPKNCFIDFRDFKDDYSKLIKFIITMSEEEYTSYINNIKNFLSTEQAHQRFDKIRAQNFLNNL